MTDYLPRLSTVGEVARQLKAPVQRIEYILRTRPHIQAKATAGGARCFDMAAIAQIRHELNTIDAKKRQAENDR